MSKPVITRFARRGQAVEFPDVRATFRVVYSRPCALVDVLGQKFWDHKVKFRLESTDGGYSSVTNLAGGVEQAGGRTTLRFEDLKKGRRYTLRCRRRAGAEQTIFEDVPYEHIVNCGEAQGPEARRNVAATLAPVRFMESPEAAFPEGQEPAKPEAGAAEPVWAEAETLAERWLYLFRARRKPGYAWDDPSPEAFAVEPLVYYADDGGLYVEGSLGNEEKPSGPGAKDLVLPVEVLGRSVSYFAWSSPFALPEGHVRGPLLEEARRPLAAGDSSDQLPFLVPLRLVPEGPGPRSRFGWRTGDPALVHAGTARRAWEVCLPDYLSAAEHLQTDYDQKLRQERRWKRDTAALRQLTDLTAQVAEARDDLKDDISEDCSRWGKLYEKQKKKLVEKVEEAAAPLVRCLHHPGLKATLLQHEMAGGRRAEDAERRYAAAQTGLSLSTVGQRFLKDELDKSPVGEGVDGLAPALKPEALERQEIRTFPYLKQVFGLGRKATKSYFSILEEVAVVVPKYFETEPFRAAQLTCALLMKDEERSKGDLVIRRGQALGGAELIIAEKPLRTPELTRREGTQVTHYRIVPIKDKYEGRFFQRDLEVRVKVSGTIETVNVALAGFQVLEVGVGANRETFEAVQAMVEGMQVFRQGSALQRAGGEAMDRMLGRAAAALGLVVGAWKAAENIEEGNEVAALADAFDAASAACLLVGTGGRVLAGRAVMSVSFAASTTLGVIGLVISGGLLIWELRKARRRDKLGMWMRETCLWRRVVTQATYYGGGGWHRDSIQRKYQQRFMALVGEGEAAPADGAGPARENAAFRKDILKQIQQLYEVIYDYEVSVDVRAQREGSYYRRVEPADVEWVGMALEQQQWLEIRLATGHLPPVGSFVIDLKMGGVDKSGKPLRGRGALRVAYELDDRAGKGVVFRRLTLRDAQEPDSGGADKKATHLEEVSYPDVLHPTEEHSWVGYTDEVVLQFLPAGDTKNPDVWTQSGAMLLEGLDRWLGYYTRGPMSAPDLSIPYDRWIKASVRLEVPLAGKEKPYFVRRPASYDEKKAEKQAGKDFEEKVRMWGRQERRHKAEKARGRERVFTR